MLYVSACLSVCSSQPTLCHSSFDSLRRHSLNIIRYDSQKLVFPSHSFVIPQLFSATPSADTAPPLLSREVFNWIDFLWRAGENLSPVADSCLILKNNSKLHPKRYFPRVRMTRMWQSYKIFNNKVHRFHIWYCFRFIHSHSKPKPKAKKSNSTLNKLPLKILHFRPQVI